MATKEDVYEYLTTTPNNTNPAVLKSLLNNLGGSGGGSHEIDSVTVTITPTNITSATISFPLLQTIREQDYIKIDSVEVTTGPATIIPTYINGSYYIKIDCDLEKGETLTVSYNGESHSGNEHWIPATVTEIGLIVSGDKK